MRKFILVILFLLSPVIAVLRAQDSADYALREVASGFSRPVLVTHAGDNRLFVVEQDGRIEIIDNGTVRSTAFLDVASLITRSGNEQGLLGMAFHPDYAQNGWFFINYTNRSGDTVVARYTVSSDPNVANAASAVTVLTVDQPFSNHNGGNLVFGPDGYLYIGLGDGGSSGDPQNRAQNRQMLLGKLLRINVDQLPYTIPSSNPFAGSTSTLPEIWALGLRNPWRYSFDRATGDLYIADVGQNAWEEVNFQPASSPGGENYGWNVYEGTHSFSGGSLSSVTMPVAEYNRGSGCSVTGGYVYRGTLAPGLEGVYLYGDYCTGIIWAMQRDSGGRWISTQFMDTDFNISSFGEDLRGDVYVTDLGGSVLRLEAVTPPATPSPTFTPTASQTPPPTLTPTLTPTETPPPTLTPTFTVTSSPTDTATLPPTNTPEPTLTETPVTTNTATLPSSNTPEPMLTQPPSGPTLFVQVIPPVASVGETVAATLNMTDVTGLYGLQAVCSVDPAVLSSVGQADGSGFNTGNSYIVDHGFQPDGRWLVAASRLAPNEAITGGAVAFSLVYSVRSAGSSPVTCDVLAVDKDGAPLALTVVNGSFNTAIQATATTEATIEPTLTETPVVEPTFTETPTAEPTITETLEVVTTPDPTGESTVSGSAAYQNRADNAGIAVQLLGLDGSVVAETVTAADGAYTFADVALGAYLLQVSAPLHVTLQRAVLVEAGGQMIAVPETVLPGGDTDDNGVIDVTDATFIGANYDVSAPPAPANADLNSDGLVNITDLVLVGGNFGLAGPVVVE